MRTAVVLLVVALLPSVAGHVSAAQPARLEYRVVFAIAHELERRLDEAGQQGFSCAMVARPDPDAPVQGVAVVMSRPTGATAPVPITHRVVKAPSVGSGQQEPINQASADGYRLCGLAFYEEAIVAVLTQAPGKWTYGSIALSDYREALVRLNLTGKDGFVPVAVSSLNNNRVPTMRNWVVVTEQPATARRKIDVAVRSASGPDSLQKNLAEQAGQGYRAALAWKEGNDFVVMMTREAGASTASVSYAVEPMPSAGMHSVSRPYIFDAPYLSDQRIVVTEKSGSVSNEVVEDPLPPIVGQMGTAAPGPLGTLGDHLSRLRDYVVSSVTVRRGPRNVLVLRTVLAHP